MSKCMLKCVFETSKPPTTPGTIFFEGKWAGKPKANNFVWYLLALIEETEIHALPSS